MLIWCFVSIKFIKSFLKFYFVISLFKRFPNLNGKMVPFHSTDIIMVALFGFSYAVFTQKGIIFFFLFVCSFLIKLQNQSIKHHLISCLKFIFTIYLPYMAFKIKRSQKYIYFQKIKDFIG